MSALKPNRTRVTRLRQPLAALVALASLVAAKRAAAQADTNPVMQNVLLLVDTSGSMEYANDGTTVQCDQVDPTLPTTTNPKGPSQKTRWTQLVEVLTGDVKDYGCYTQDRSSGTFLNEYKLGTANPYDYNYHVPYHRILSGTGATACTVGAGVPDSNPFSWGSTPFKHHLWNDAASTCANFQQSETGLLDTYRDNIRFGLMTFDTSVDAGTGISGNSPDYVSGNLGTWSYFLNWRQSPNCDSNPACAKGRPAGCSTPPAALEVGARNAAAPPWEGRMVPFGSPVAAISDVRTTNDHIQQVLGAIRPFGATPINGLLNDARNFLRNDIDDDYVTGGTCDGGGLGCFGPSRDPYVLTKGPTGDNPCRANNIILLTDGEPNLDLRPYCEGTSAMLDGVCPYTDKSFEIVQDLASKAGGSTKTYVIGFAVSTVDTGQPSPVDCSKISAHSTSGDTFDPNDLCGATMDPKLSACCTLAKIAFYGGTTNAHFATDATELRTEMASVLGEIFSVQSTRTVPVFASNSGASAKLGGSDAFFSEFKSSTGSVWTGVLRRQRTRCEQNPSSTSTLIEPKAIDIDDEKGDVFSENVNAADGSHPRLFYTVEAEADGSGIRRSDRSIRPANPDGIGSVTGTSVSGGVNDFYPPKFPAQLMQITKPACTTLPLPGTDDECAAMFMKWEIGADPTPYPNKRADVFGAIYHSTPTFVSAPADFLRDESYTQFTVEQVKRPPMVYTSTTDGQLHAFKVDVSPADPADTFTIDKKVNNELWSFFPPAVLPRISAQYPSAQQVLLDGAPVVKDVVFTRNDAEAKNGGGSVKWHTVLLSGFGAGGTGYFAVDVTNPVPKDATVGPKLLWQLTTDDAGNRLFGKRGGTPAIATLFFSLDGGDPQEYAVAILPGGESDGPIAGPGPTPFSCQRLAAANHVDSTFAPRSDVRCWADDPARSLTIVVLETGEVVRSFRRQTDAATASLLARSHDASNVYTPLSAPISGQPVVYPSETGTVTDRAFVGDRDGMVWRIDLSKPDPRDWSMDLFLDTYQGGAFNDGQPIATPPILSVDNLGNVTMDVSTGDQETFVSDPNMKNYVWSVKEDPTATVPFSSQVQWRKLLTGGQRVSGPMALFSSTLFYTTFTPPPTTDICSFGNSRLCAVNYVLPMDPMNLDKGGAKALDSIKTSDTDPCIDLSDQIVFGPGITQTPTCFTDDAYNDPYLGTSQHSGLANVNPGTFSLVVQTGKANNNKNVNAPPNIQTFSIPQPRTSTRIDSWAAVVE